MLLEIDVATIIFEILNFLVLIWLLNRFVFRPVTEKVKRRADEKQRLLREIKDDREAAAELRSNWESQLANIEEEIETLVAETQARLEDERKALLQETQAEAERILSAARQEATRLQRQALAEFHDELLNAVLDVSKYVIREVTPDETQVTFAQEFIQRIWELGRQEMDRVEAIRRSLLDRTTPIRVQTARPLSAEIRGELARTMSALVDHDVELAIDVEPDLVLGMHVRVGDVIIDNSLASQLDDLRSTVSQKLNERLTEIRA